MINIHLQVLAWSLVTAVSRRQLPGREEASLGQVTPRHTWTGHALPVTGIHVGHGPAHSARVVSSSLDMTVKIYSMTTGKEMFHNLHGSNLSIPFTLIIEEQQLLMFLLDK